MQNWASPWSGERPTKRQRISTAFTKDVPMIHVANQPIQRISESPIPLPSYASRSTNSESHPVSSSPSSSLPGSRGSSSHPTQPAPASAQPSLPHLRAPPATRPLQSPSLAPVGGCRAPLSHTTVPVPILRPPSGVVPVLRQPSERQFSVSGGGGVRPTQRSAVKTGPSVRPTQPSQDGESSRLTVKERDASGATLHTFQETTLTKPYLSASARKRVSEGLQSFLPAPADHDPAIIHVDFSDYEVYQLLDFFSDALRVSASAPEEDVRKRLRTVYRQNEPACQVFLARVGNFLTGRSASGIKAFLDDLSRGKEQPSSSVFSLREAASSGSFQHGESNDTGQITALLMSREVSGRQAFSSVRRTTNFTNEFVKLAEDELALRAEWTNCAGDINTVTWVSQDAFICGTTEHSDDHNQQYNKPGNLLIGSCSAGTLKAYPDHRVIRPVVRRGENATEDMRQSQDPWLYTSVTSSDFDEVHQRAYTCSFDRTVKVWEAEKMGSSMQLLGTWPHDGNVNFVVSSKHKSGLVATAADVHTEAVRVYRVNGADISGSSYNSYSCSRVVDADGRDVSTERWAYFPATMQWGRCPEASHFLLVGYSPRSRTHDDNDIPEDRQGTGELCLWDGLTGKQWRLLAGSTLNIFEVSWHPSQPSFIAATSPQGVVGSELDARIRTQIRIFRKSLTEERAFGVIQTLDCTAVDINELSIKPNGPSSSYIAAGCTDGRAYIYDTALGDKPIHVLKHGKAMEDFRDENRSDIDTGIKFCVWSKSSDRFYTGSSDGVVKVWNVRAKKPFVRNLLEGKGPISYGKFSPDGTRLIVGDASGRVFFLSIHEDDQKLDQVTSVGNHPVGIRRRVPRLMIPHPEPPPPADYLQREDGRSLGHSSIQAGQIIFNRDPTIGAVQGPRYAEMGRFNLDAHDGGIAFRPLIALVQRRQLEDIRIFDNRGSHVARRVRLNIRDPARVKQKHYKNSHNNDFDYSSLSVEEQRELAKWPCGLTAKDFEVDYGLPEAGPEFWAASTLDDWMLSQLPRECEGCTADGCAPTLNQLEISRNTSGRAD